MPVTQQIEQQLRKKGYNYIAGLDEAGRGAWAGPLVAASVIFDKPARLPHLRDSKNLPPRKREEFYKSIIKQAASWSVAIIKHKVIDRNGMTEACRLAFSEAVAKLGIAPEFMLIDGPAFTTFSILHRFIIRGDEKVFSIACASIIAKVTRDRLMVSLASRYPGYAFETHKGYGTREHFELISRFGPTPLHRRSFAPIKSLLARKHKNMKT